MPAAERRRLLIETTIRVFSDGSYRGTTTAEIARAAGISEPILYRHFASKRELYLAALDHVWSKARAKWTEVLDGAYGTNGMVSWYKLNVDSNNDVIRVFHGNGPARMLIRSNASAKQVVDLLKNSSQPMFDICLSDEVRRVRGELVRGESSARKNRSDKKDAGSERVRALRRAGRA